PGHGGGHALVRRRQARRRRPGARLRRRRGGMPAHRAAGSAAGLARRGRALRLRAGIDPACTAGRAWRRSRRGGVRRRRPAPSGTRPRTAPRRTRAAPPRPEPRPRPPRPRPIGRAPARQPDTPPANAGFSVPSLAAPSATPYAVRMDTPSPPAAQRPRLTVRQAALADIPAIAALTERVYGKAAAYTPEMIRGQLMHFPEGQFVATLGEHVVGYCSTFRVAEGLALSPHTWTEITGGGYAVRHDPHGDWLYGLEVCVDPEQRRMRIGQRLYDARKRLCRSLGLAGIVFGGRIPSAHRRWRQYGSVEALARAVAAGQARDPTLSFQLRQGFELIGVLPDFLPGDHESLGHAAHLAWRNPKLGTHPKLRGQPDAARLPEKVRVATVQYQQRAVSSFEEFAANVEYFVAVCADYRSDFCVLPELITLQLLSATETPLSASESIDVLTGYTPRWRELLS